jgi:hypothetical protein
MHLIIRNLTNVKRYVVDFCCPVKERIGARSCGTGHARFKPSFFANLTSGLTGGSVVIFLRLGPGSRGSAPYLPFLEVDREQRNVGGCDTADATGLTERGRPNFVKFLPSLDTQSSDIFVVQPIGYSL